jgi:hypothetical protein
MVVPACALSRLNCFHIVHLGLHRWWWPCQFRLVDLHITQQYAGLELLVHARMICMNLGLTRRPPPLFCLSAHGEPPGRRHAMQWHERGVIRVVALGEFHSDQHGAHERNAPRDFLHLHCPTTILNKIQVGPGHLFRNEIISYSIINYTLCHICAPNHTFQMNRVHHHC